MFKTNTGLKFQVKVLSRQVSHCFYEIHKHLPVAVIELTVIIISDQISFQYITNKAKDKTAH